MPGNLGPRDISLQEVIAFLSNRGAAPTNENVNRARESGAVGQPTNLLEGHNNAMDLLGEGISQGNAAPLTPVDVQELGPAPTDPFANARPAESKAVPPTNVPPDEGQVNQVGSPVLDAIIAAIVAQLTSQGIARPSANAVPNIRSLSGAAPTSLPSFQSPPLASGGPVPATRGNIDPRSIVQALRSAL